MTGQYGSDIDICHAARVSTTEERHEELSLSRQEGLIRALVRDKHGSPTEAGYFSFLIDAPRAVRDEHVRHRVAWSFSSSSLRYKQGLHRVYVPPRERPLRKAKGFKQIRPVYEQLSDEEYERYISLLKEGYTATYAAIEKLQKEGFTETEATRWLTHDGRMTPYVARANPRSIMSFLALRTHDETANHVSFPQWEIEVVARKIEGFFAHYYPLTYAAFNEFGREAP